MACALFKKFFSSDRGMTSIEYALLAGTMSAVLAGAGVLYGDSFSKFRGALLSATQVEMSTSAPTSSSSSSHRDRY